MTRRLIAVEIDGTIMTLRGWKAHGLALGAGLRPTYNGVHQGWVADTKRLGDLLAYLGYRNIPVEVTEVGAEDLGDRHAEDVGDLDVDPPDIDVQLDLFGGGGE